MVGNSRWKLIAVAFFLFSACATPYQSRGVTGGYSDVQIDSNTFNVEFRGNGHTPRQQVEMYLLYRCAQITDQNGYDYFIMVDKDTEVKQGSVNTPGSFNSYSTGSATIYGNSVQGSSVTNGTYSPGQTIHYRKYHASTMIKVFKGEKPKDNPLAFNAKEIIQFLGPKIEGPEQ